MDKNVCKHIAIIMDGNGRWAKRRGMPRSFGHKKGAENVVEITRAAKDAGIEYLTLYAFSTENWQRPKEEVDTLMQLLREYLDKGFKDIMENNVRILFIGEKNMLAADILEKIRIIEEKSADNTALTLCVALSYGSRQEILSAVRKTVQQVVDKKITVEEINQNLFSLNLYTADIPDPDILIRTSGEQRISNYLLWQIAYTELFFTDTLWPDFNKNELFTILENFSKRERRYGKS